MNTAYRTKGGPRSDSETSMIYRCLFWLKTHRVECQNFMQIRQVIFHINFLGGWEKQVLNVQFGAGWCDGATLFVVL